MAMNLRRGEAEAIRLGLKSGSDGRAELHGPQPYVLRVLCVDDFHDSADTLGALLRIYGCDVKVCYDGPSALALAESFRPDVCVLDLTMPGMDGDELARLF